MRGKKHIKGKKFPERIWVATLNHKTIDHIYWGERDYYSTGKGEGQARK